jgi:hypothetical protein
MSDLREGAKIRRSSCCASKRYPGLAGHFRKAASIDHLFSPKFAPTQGKGLGRKFRGQLWRVLAS